MKPSRRRRESATAQGCRYGITNRALAPISSSRSRQSGMRRVTRGSLKPQSALPWNSAAMMSCSCSRQRLASGPSCQPSGSGSVASQRWPRSASRRSLASTIPKCSQNPFWFSSLAAIRLLPSSTPSKLHTRDTRDVPLRCTPAMITTVGVSRPRALVCTCRRGARGVLSIIKSVPAGRFDMICVSSPKYKRIS